MLIKADCLHNAGVISEGEKQWVHCKARPFLADEALNDVAFLKSLTASLSDWKPAVLLIRRQRLAEEHPLGQ